MNIAHAADIHLGHRQYGLKQREIDTKLSFQHFLGQAAKHSTNAILIPGDLFDSRDIRPQTLQQAESLLEDIEPPVIVSPGNHDENISRRRDLTWLEYLNNKGLITLVAADLTTKPATFHRTQTDTPRHDGGGFVDLETDDELIRCFGLQYRGAYTQRELPAVAQGIRDVNNEHGTPDRTVLLAHFGVEDAVPDIGATVSRAALTELEAVVDYLALGHIHKQFEIGDEAHNPGSLEAFDVQEGRWDTRHGYYIYDTEDDSAAHYRSKRRPYYTLNFDVSEYRTFEDLRGDFEDTLSDAKPEVEAVCEDDIYRTAAGDRRDPIINLRLEGTILLGHATFDIERLTSLAKDRLDALYVQPTDSTERKAVQDILGDLDRGDAFNSDGTVNTNALQKKVFTTIAAESRYSDADEAVAETLDDLEGLVNEDNESVAAVAGFLKDRRRKLFPDGLSQSKDGEDSQNDAPADATETVDDGEVTSE